MSTNSTKALLGALLGLVLAACAPAETPTPIIIVETVEVTVTPESTPLAVPFLEQWGRSEHADEGAPAFRSWDGGDPAELPLDCAKCHTEPGFIDFLGLDETAAGIVDESHPAGSVITCVACHNEATLEMSSVVLVSGHELRDLGAQARCVECHQTSATRQDLDTLIAGASEDTVSDDLEFIEIHAGASSALRYGTVAGVGYEYADKQYDTAFMHVEGYEACQDCHDPHTLDIKLSECAECHEGVVTVNDLHALRSIASQVDYDGDGDLKEGVRDEILGLQAKLLTAMRSYAEQVTQTPLGYHPTRSPYFFHDLDSNGQISPDEAEPDNRFNAWTPRLLKAAFNFHLVRSDAGAYAHGGKYAIQLLWDSIESLNENLAEPVDLVKARRSDHAHFAGSLESFRNWDNGTEAEVPADCGKCHSAAGLPFLVRQGELAEQPTSNGLRCSTCHAEPSTGTLYDAVPVIFPAGSGPDGASADVLTCTTCHLSTETVEAIRSMVASLDPDAVSRRLEMIDLHTNAVGATLFGSESSSGYEYPGKVYAGRFLHVSAYDSCSECHDAHTLRIEAANCQRCHLEVISADDLRTLRLSLVDFDGDGNTREGLYDELRTQREVLLASIQAYVSGQLETSIIYDRDSFPYFYLDSDDDGNADPDEIQQNNRFREWTPRLLRAAFNLHYTSVDPGGYAHNGKYLLQLLYDSIEDVGGSVTGMTRP